MGWRDGALDIDIWVGLFGCLKPSEAGLFCFLYLLATVFFVCFVMLLFRQQEERMRQHEDRTGCMLIARRINEIMEQCLEVTLLSFVNVREQFATVDVGMERKFVGCSIFFFNSCLYDDRSRKISYVGQRRISASSI